MHVILAEAELELVPEEIAGHPAVRKHAQAQGKKPTQMLLDANHHWQASRGLPDGERRGRPDITQMTLLALMESPLNKSGGLSLSIHTRNGLHIRIRPDTRLPRGEARFQGLLARVLATGKSQDKDPLIWSEGKRTPEQVLDAVGGTAVRLDDADGFEDADTLAARLGKDATLVIGGFPSGTFGDAWKAATPEAASIWPEPLVAWAVAAECASAWRRL